jgi:putative RecB family exonuclease
MNRSRPHWSYSAITQYLRCPLQFYFQRVLKLPSRTISSGLALGSVIHSVLADYHNRLKDGRSIEINTLLDSVNDHWQAKEAVEQILFRDGETRDDTIAQGIHLVERYLHEPPPENILAVEEEFLVPLQNRQGDYLETPLIAVTDLLTSHDGRVVVQEFKTSGRSYSAADIETSLQPTCYFQAVKQSTEQEPEIEYTVLVKTKTPKIQRLKTHRSESDSRRLGDLVETIQRAVDRQVFYPVENPLNCSGCPFRQECRDWKPAPEIDDLISSKIPQECSACSPN